MTMTSTRLRAAEIAVAIRAGSSTSVWSGESVRATTFIPLECAAAMSKSAFDRAAVGLVAPAVGDRPDALDPERRGHVTGHGVGIDEQDRLALADLERRREVGRDGRLADAALRVEDRDRRGAAMPAAEVAALEDRAAAVVDGLAPDAHRLDPPADRVGRVGPREVFVE